MEQEDAESGSLVHLLRRDTEEGGVADGTASLTSPTKQQYCNRAEIVAEFKSQIRLSGPLVVVGFLQYSLQMISIMFVGHLGELPLASASTATSFAGVTGFSVMLGLGGALETLCGQAYGAREYHILGVHMQRAMIIVTLVCFPISFLWGYTEQIFLFFKQDPQVSMHAQTYALCLIPSLLPYGFLQCQTRFLQAQNIVYPLLLCTGVASFLHVLLCWTLIFRFGFGNYAAALSVAVSYWANVIILAAYIKFSSACEKTWTGFSKLGAKNLLGFLKLGIPSALMVCLEFWPYEFLVLMSGLLQNPKLETSMMSISLDTTSVIFKIPVGLGSAVSTRVANELGAGRPRAAHLAVQVVMFLAVTQGLLLSLVFVAVRGLWGLLYTNEVEVVNYLASVTPVLAISNFMDGLQSVLSGAVRGCGWQNIGTLVNLGAYYLVGLPCSVLFCFVLNLGGKGLWIGIIFGSSVQAILLLIVTWCTNWQAEVKKARDRVLASTYPPDMATEVY